MPPPVGSNKLPLLYTEDPISNFKLLFPVALLIKVLMDLFICFVNNWDMVLIPIVVAVNALLLLSVDE